MKSAEQRKMEAGMLYQPAAAEIMREQRECLRLLRKFNMSEPEDQNALLKKMFAEFGEGCYIEPPLFANWGGRHVHFGKNVYANFHLTLVDDGHIYVGDSVMFGPNVTIATAGHPIDPALRAEGLQYNADVYIGSNVWIGAGAIILPGIHIGENSVIGAGSIVTHDIPANVVAVGNPCRVLRAISQKDKEFYFKDRRI